MRVPAHTQQFFLRYAQLNTVSLQGTKGFLTINKALGLKRFSPLNIAWIFMQAGSYSH